MNTKRLFIPITKVDAVQGIVYGVAASEAPDAVGEVFDYTGSKPHFEKWSADIHKATDGKSFGNLRSMHGAVAAGKLNAIAFNDDDLQIEIAAKVVDPVELEKVIEGVYTGFSIGGKYEKRWKDGDLQRYIAVPHEISLVDLPCIPNAQFEVVKGQETELRKFKPTEPVVVEPSNDEIATKARELAKAAGNEADWLSQIDAAKAALAKAAPAEVKPAHSLDLAVTAVDEAPAAGGGADDLGAEQVWTHKSLPGQTFGKKSELRAALDAKAAADRAATLAAPVTDALKALNADLDARGVGKNASDNPDFTGKDGGKDKAGEKDKKAAPAKSEKEKAKDEADKSKDQPMKSAADVVGRAKLLESAALPSFVEKRLIVDTADDLGALALLPEGFIEADFSLAKALPTGDLAKSAGIYSVSRLVDIVGSVDSLLGNLSSSSGSYYYGGDGTRIEVSDATISGLKAAAKNLGSLAAALLDEVLSAMASEDAAKAIGRGTAFGTLRKIGARNSASDKTRLRKAHDLLAEIEPAMCESDGHKHVDGGDVAKQLKAQEDAFTKTLGEIGDVVKDVAERVKRIEAQPVDGRPSHYRTVDKFAADQRIIPGDGVEVLEAARQNSAAYAEISGEMARLSYRASGHQR